MVERGGLENRCARERTEGSNPSLSVQGRGFLLYQTMLFFIPCLIFFFVKLLLCEIVCKGCSGCSSANSLFEKAKIL